MRGGDEKALFLVEVDGKEVKRRGWCGREAGRQSERERARRSSFFMYASRRLYIALEAREGTISISFDKNKHCRGMVRADLPPSAKYIPVRCTDAHGCHEFDGRSDKSVYALKLNSGAK